ncbi:hypothetical protein [Aneurinibacillus migulanus]|nr:hypothetical protein [Aneurinibacillus migulanus]MED4732331.1 hypothetical protein [Aneurinibacillus migulanus]
MEHALLQIEKISVAFQTPYQNVEVVHNVNFDIHKGETVGLG